MPATIKDALALKINGQVWDGWEGGRLTSVYGKALCGSFEFTLSDRWRQPGSGVRPIRTGDAAEIWVGSELRQTVWIEDVNPSYGPRSHLISVSGREITCDLVDCSSPLTTNVAGGKGKGSKSGKKSGGTGSWSNVKLEKIAADLCLDFGIPVIDGDDTGKPIAQVHLQLGETPFEIIEKLCRSRNVWPTTTPRGELQFLKASKVKLDGVLKRGLDIEEASARYSDRGRYSDYIGRGQQRGSDTVSATAAAHVSAAVNDPTIRRFRPLIVQGEDQQNGETLADRVKNEMAKRIGDSRSVEIKVAGWRMKDGTIWPVNRLLAIDDAWLGLRDTYLIEQAVYEIGRDSHSTTLTLVPPQKLDITYSGSVAATPAIGSQIITDDAPWSGTQGPL
jgi:prophage tail gpP-like protein